ncbi:hypothetical protein A6U94_00685 [Agrobacterium tumefaciens]|nr:hypothetical protein A6U94_00685 [Agrobacterium tumefaciens]
MTGGPLARFRGLFAASVASGPKNASTAFKPPSIFKPLVVALMATTVGAINLPFDEAIDFLRQKTAVPTESHRDVWDAAHSKMFMVAGANKKALVEDFQAAIVKAAEQGLTLEDFRADFDAIVARHGWQYNGSRGWRSRLIFETNLSTAYAAGRYAQMSAPETLEAFPYWMYNHSGAIHPRLEHKAWDGECYEATDPVWAKMYPPNGYRCGCFVTPVSRPGLRRLGKSGPDTPPNLDQLGTDQPRGIDPSFAYNPGAAWLSQTAPGPKAVSADQAQVAAFVQSALKGKWPDGSWTPVATTNKTVGAALDVAGGTEIRLSADTIRSHMHHDTITPDGYGVLPGQLVKGGKLLRDRNGRPAFVGEYDGKLYHAAVKVVKKDNRKEVWLTSLRRTERRNILRNFGVEWK